jgi:hypothetical protein
MPRKKKMDMRERKRAGREDTRTEQNRERIFA